MKIRDWQHAIDLTIERYQYAIDNNISFPKAKKILLPEDWDRSCPICMYATLFAQSEEKKCDNCLWLRFENRPCCEQYDESIKRLKRWKYILNERR